MVQNKKKTLERPSNAVPRSVSLLEVSRKESSTCWRSDIVSFTPVCCYVFIVAMIIFVDLILLKGLFRNYILAVIEMLKSLNA